MLTLPNNQAPYPRRCDLGSTIPSVVFIQTQRKGMPPGGVPASRLRPFVQCHEHWLTRNIHISTRIINYNLLKYVFRRLPALLSRRPTPPSESKFTPLTALFFGRSDSDDYLTRLVPTAAGRPVTQTRSTVRGGRRQTPTVTVGT